MTEQAGAGAGFLAAAETTPEVRALYDDDLAELGFVMNAARLWAYQPATQARLFEVMAMAFRDSELGFRHRALLVLASASARQDSYCSLAWGHKLAADGGAEAARAVLTGADDGLAPDEAALVAWTRRVVTDPNSTSAADVDALRAAGFTDRQIFAVTTFAALRMAFSTVNDALGARPDAEWTRMAPPPVAAAVTYGRSPVD